MEKCKSCNKKLSFRKVFKSFWKGYKPIECSNCNKIYEHTFKNRILGGVSVGIGIFVGGIMMNYFETEIGIKLLYGFLFTLIFSMLSSSICTIFFSFEQKQIVKTTSNNGHK